MTKKIQTHVGTLADMGKRFTEAWHRAEAGEDFDETHVTFLSFEQMNEALSPKRITLLRHVHRFGANSVRGLAGSLHRNYKNVHQDVMVLERFGLLRRNGRQLTAPWDQVQSSIDISAA